MKRDMELVRLILMELAEADAPINAKSLASDEYTQEEIAYHFQIMDEAGLIVASITASGNCPYYFALAKRLSWAGNDFLDAVRSESVWRKATQVIGKTVESASFEVVTSVVKSIALSMTTGALQGLL